MNNSDLDGQFCFARIRTVKGSRAFAVLEGTNTLVKMRLGMQRFPRLSRCHGIVFDRSQGRELVRMGPNMEVYGLVKKLRRGLAAFVWYAPVDRLVRKHARTGSSVVAAKSPEEGELEWFERLPRGRTSSIHI